MSYYFRHKESFFFAGCLLIYILSVLVNLGVLEFSGEEPRRAMISVEMLDSGNFIHPTQYGWAYYNKPPFFNWILAFVIWLTGSVSESILRLPSLFFYLLMAFVHYKVCRHFFPKATAALSAFFLLTCVDVYTYGLAYGVEIDIFYSLVVYLQAICIFWFYTKQKYLLLYTLSYLFCAVGFLTKAFPSILFQVLTLGALCVYAQSLRPLFRWQHLAGIAVFLAVTGGYFFLYSQYNDPMRFLTNLMQEAMLKSGIGERSARLVDKALIYPWLFFKMFLPWSALLLLLFSKVRFAFRQNPLVWFSVLFTLFNIWVYWLTGQPKIRYVYMFLPFGCVILTQAYQRFIDSKPQVFGWIMKYVGMIYVIPLLAVITFPIYADASAAWIIGLSLAFLGLLYRYYRFPDNRIWWFLVGFMLLRLVYAALFIPVQREGIESYSEHMQKVAKATNGAPLQYWAAADKFSIGAKTALFTYPVEMIKMPATLPLEPPYYYYRHTGQIIRFDTVRRGTPYYVSFEVQLGDKRVDTLYSFYDRNLGQRVVFFKSE